jgi:hypothetical protein
MIPCGNGAATMAMTKDKQPDRNIFLSWSGNRSGHVASAFREWLPKVLQGANVWMSKKDIIKGTSSRREISQQLEACTVGVVFVTADNMDAPWLNFEAGAISKAVSDSARTCTVLLDGLKPTDVMGPLADFQHTVANKNDLRALVLVLAHAIGAIVTDDDLAIVFDAIWPLFEPAVKPAPPNNALAKPGRSDRELLEEVLEVVRGLKQDSIIREIAVHLSQHKTSELARVHHLLSTNQITWESGGFGSVGISTALPSDDDDKEPDE